jgi:2-polyprenyl-6-hydroxyphenyl methylase/3-demethylubiquinone-9 3-methyltransferase
MRRGYYDQKLSALRLKCCYEIAPLRVQQYLEAEIDYVLQHVEARQRVLELGCGYGRVLARLAERAHLIVGIDISRASLQYACNDLHHVRSCHLIQMNALSLGFRDHSFDLVVCVQNGISAFQVEPHALMREAIRVTRSRGTILFSTYSDAFWLDRLEWFQLQAAEGLLGEIDWQKSRDGEIVCKDGFQATTVRPEQFRNLVADLGVQAEIREIDESSLFCKIKV